MSAQEATYSQYSAYGYSEIMERPTEDRPEDRQVWIIEDRTILKRQLENKSFLPVEKRDLIDGI